MSFSRRLCTVGILLALAMVAYAVASRYSAKIVIYVVEQTLIQKSPPGSDPTVVRQRFRAHMEALSGEDAKLQKALTLSQYLEKFQRLSSFQLESLIEGETKPTP